MLYVCVCGMQRETSVVVSERELRSNDDKTVCLDARTSARRKRRGKGRGLWAWGVEVRWDKVRK